MWTDTPLPGGSPTQSPYLRVPALDGRQGSCWKLGQLRVPNRVHSGRSGLMGERLHLQKRSWVLGLHCSHPRPCRPPEGRAQDSAPWERSAGERPEDRCSPSPAPARGGSLSKTCQRSRAPAPQIGREEARQLSPARAYPKRRSPGVGPPALPALTADLGPLDSTRAAALAGSRQTRIRKWRASGRHAPSSWYPEGLHPSPS